MDNNEFTHKTYRRTRSYVFVGTLKSTKNSIKQLIAYFGGATKVIDLINLPRK